MAARKSGLGRGLDALLAAKPAFVTKEQVKREIRSNHFMTTKVIEALAKEGWVRVEVQEGHYRIFLTKEGALHVRRYNDFYRRVYQEQIRDHYAYTKAPFWLRE